MKKLIEAIKDSPFDYDLVDDEIDLHCYTPAGEDWEFYVTDEEDFKQYAENFDPEEEFKMWVETRNVVSGVPDIPTLWKDQLWKQEKLKEVANAL